MDRIQLYSLATPNGQKVSIALEELGLPYDAHTIDIMAGDQFSDEFIRINPNSKIPAIVDLNPDNIEDGQPLPIMESGAILLYLAEKTGKLLSADPRLRVETLQWLFFQVGGIGPMFGQFGHFYRYGRDNCDHPYPVERYATEARRLLGVLETRLEGRHYLVGEAYSIADIATFPWVICLDRFYEASEKLGLSEFPNVAAWVERCRCRPASVRGLEVCRIERD
ncbi:glutathione binding-like protein [Dongshaea marina]|uniref:glutathione binding-like protein n=1 Tax=Dongshaea marina TaxID=2047966 RepID=UPI000D3E8B39|nr:glutathione binding-like protein [Dongshaea marina]